MAGVQNSGTLGVATNTREGVGDGDVRKLALRHEILPGRPPGPS